ncbi:MAG: FecR domain-containing protein [Opitutaceae bacterium]|nr:FecR domain-containing protein [Opitutaceae bacterium]
MNKSELNNLISKLIDDDISSEETRQLLDHCKKDGEALSELVSSLELERSLRSLGPSESFSEAFIDEALVRIRLESEISKSTDNIVEWEVPSRNRKTLRKLGGLVMAAAASLALILLLQSQFRLNSTLGGRAEIARVTSLEDVEWSTENIFSVGDWIPARTLDLRSGYAELEFSNGTQLLIEGPASLDIVDSMNVRMRYGKASARVPESGHGFTIDSPVAQIVDLGTEFGVEVLADGNTEVHVLNGLVEARAHDTEDFKRLSKDQAMRVSGNQITYSKADPSRFLRNLPDRDQQIPAKFIRWSFDDGEGMVASSENLGLSTQVHDAHLKSIFDSLPGPSWGEGVFGGCLKFDGKDDSLETDFIGIDSDKARTVAFWVKAPDSMERNGFAILGYGKWETGQAWQISLNPDEHEGPLGRIRVGAKDGVLIGNTDLRDGRWHHVAVVLYPGRDVNLATNVLIYLDGSLEQTSRKSFLTIDTSTKTDAFPVTMGRAADAVDKSSYRENSFFEGSLDEVYIFDSAISKSQVQSLMKSNEI